uniref:Transposase MuDR plant domain-containing protein n=1 Tax=Nelumbo nucifera TaxID=4432 RepID=A0A822ZHB3_NELNU|nr:TPA_asm: hypothetical protein HUJ06_001291 [Nelumbo nucifera]
MESHIERHVDNEELEVIQDADLNMPNEHEDYNEHREAMFDYEFSEDEDNDGGHGVIEVDINEEDTRIQIEDDNGLSDYEPVSEYASLIDLDDDDARHALEVSFNIEVPNLQVGMCFPSIKEFRAALKEHIIVNGFQIKYIKNEKSRVIAQCAWEDCPWHIHASPLQDGLTYCIKSLNPEHNCSRIYRNKQATNTWIAEKIGEKLRQNPTWKIESIVMELRQKYDIGVPRSKGPYGGILLVAVCLDGNNGIFPVGIAIVEVEARLSWTWFLQQLEDAIDITNDGHGWCFMLDRQKGLVDAVHDVMPNADHRFCV